MPDARRANSLWASAALSHLTAAHWSGCLRGAAALAASERDSMDETCVCTRNAGFLGKEKKKLSSSLYWMREDIRQFMIASCVIYLCYTVTKCARTKQTEQSFKHKYNAAKMNVHMKCFSQMYINIKIIHHTNTNTQNTSTNTPAPRSGNSLCLAWRPRPRRAPPAMPAQRGCLVAPAAKSQDAHRLLLRQWQTSDEESGSD